MGGVWEKCVGAYIIDVRGVYMRCCEDVHI